MCVGACVWVWGGVSALCWLWSLAHLCSLPSILPSMTLVGWHYKFGEELWLQGRTHWLHPTAHSEILPSLYPPYITCGECCCYTLCILKLFSCHGRQSGVCNHLRWPLCLLDGLPCTLKDGAALVYTSAREERNLAALHQYILHRAYNLPFKESASVVDRDAIFMWVLFNSVWGVGASHTISYVNWPLVQCGGLLCFE